jgi:hypothetical protein
MGLPSWLHPQQQHQQQQNRQEEQQQLDGQQQQQQPAEVAPLLGVQLQQQLPLLRPLVRYRDSLTPTGSRQPQQQQQQRDAGQSSGCSTADVVSELRTRVVGPSIAS